MTARTRGNICHHLHFNHLTCMCILVPCLWPYLAEKLLLQPSAPVFYYCTCCIWVKMNQRKKMSEMEHCIRSGPELILLKMSGIYLINKGNHCSPLKLWLSMCPEQFKASEFGLASCSASIPPHHTWSLLCYKPYSLLLGRIRECSAGVWSLIHCHAMRKETHSELRGIYQRKQEMYTVGIKKQLISLQWSPLFNWDHIPAHSIMVSSEDC